MSTDEVLTAEQAAKLLKLHVNTVYAHAAAGKLPGMRVGDTWRFSRQVLLDWLEPRASHPLENSTDAPKSVADV